MHKHGAINACWRLTQAQLGIWRGQKIAGDNNPVYNAAEAVEIQCELNQALFTECLRHTFADAEGLNCLFTEGEDDPLQQAVLLDWSCEYLDFSQSPTAWEDAWLWMRRQVRTPFALQDQYAYCNAIVKLNDRHYFWYLCIHHVLCDGYGFALLQQRVIDLYNQAIRRGAPPVNGAEFGPFTAVVEEDERYQSSPERERDRQFWLNKLTHMSAPVSLSDSQAPFSDRAIRLSTTLPGTVKSELEDVHNSPSINWSHGLIAAVVNCLYRRTGAREVTVGVPVMGRMQSASLRVPAMVMNIIPLPIVIPTDQSFASLMSTVATAMNETKPYQRYRYEHLRRDLGLLGGGQRLFGPVVNIMPFDRRLNIQQQPLTVHTISAGPVEDLAFNFIATTRGELRLTLEANAERYQPEQVAEIQAYLHEVLKTQCRADSPLQPDYRLLSWLQGPDLAQPSVDVLDRIETLVKAKGESIALTSEEGDIRYRRLWQHAGQLAQVLKYHLSTHNHTIALCIPRESNAIVLMLAALRCRGAFVFIDVDGPRERNQRILNDAAPAVVIYTSTCAWINSDEYNALELSQLLRDAQRQGAEVQLPGHSPVRVNTPAYIVYTSGSTGTPKGVCIGRQALSDFVTSAQQTYQLCADDCVLQFAPLHFDACIEEIFVTLCKGAKLHIAPSTMRQSIPEFLRACAAQCVTVLDLPTAFWHELSHHLYHSDAILPWCVRTVIIGGEAAQAKPVEQWRQCVSPHVVLWNTYGPSEATVVASCSELSRGEIDAARPVTIGKPLPGRSALVLNEHNQIIPKGQTGELALAGIGLAEGYCGAVEATEERFIKLTPPGEPPMRVYKTGDRARINKDDCIEFCGRMDDELKLSGQRVHLTEIEAALRTCQHVTDAVVLAHAPTGGKQVLHGFVTASSVIDYRTLKSELGNKLSAVMVPGKISQLDTLPITSNGKVDRKHLRKTLMDQQAPLSDPTGDETAFTIEQAWVMDVWKEVLGITHIKLEDDFFLLGGQSLQTLSVASRLSLLVKREVAVTALFDNPTVSALADYLANNACTHLPRNRQQELTDDAQLPEDLFAAPSPQSAVTESSAAGSPVGSTFTSTDFGFTQSPLWQRVLLTGASGFVGAHLLARLLSATNARVVCLVRGASHTQAREKIRHALRQQQLYMADCEQRIDVVLADLEKPNLGLDQATMIDLQNNLQAIFHNGAITSVMRDYDSLKKANVQSCEMVLRIAAPHRIPVHFISTIAVGQGLEQLPEQALDYHETLADGYQQSKWAAERLMVNGMQRGFAINIYRLARVVGALGTGFINPKDLMWNILRASVGLGLYPQLPIQEPWTPVDLVSQTIIAGALTGVTGQIFNLTPDSHVHLPELCQWTNDYGIAMEPADFQLWLAALHKSQKPEDQALFAFFEQRQGVANMALPRIDNRGAMQLMDAHGMGFPKVTRRQFLAYLKSAQAQGLLVPTPVEERV